MGLKVLGGGVVADASQDPGDWLVDVGYWRLPPVTVLASYCLCPRFCVGSGLPEWSHALITKTLILFVVDIYT